MLLPVHALAWSKPTSGPRYVIDHVHADVVSRESRQDHSHRLEPPTTDFAGLPRSSKAAIQIVRMTASWSFLAALMCFSLKEEGIQSQQRSHVAVAFEDECVLGVLDIKTQLASAQFSLLSSIAAATPQNLTN